MQPLYTVCKMVTDRDILKADVSATVIWKLTNGDVDSGRLLRACYEQLRAAATDETEPNAAVAEDLRS